MSKSADMIRQFHKEQMEDPNHPPFDPNEIPFDDPMEDPMKSPMDDPKNLLRITSLVFSNQDHLIFKMKDQFCNFLLHQIGNHFYEMSPEDFKIFIQNLMDEK